MSRRNLLIVTLTFFSIFNTTAQQNYDHYNRLGIVAGATLFDIDTSDLVTRQETGFMMGFTTRGSFSQNFDFVYGINFYNSKLGVAAFNLGGGMLDEQFVKYTLRSVQVGFLGSANIIRHHLSLEAGPILNVSGKLKLDNERFENYTIDGYSSIQTRDIEDISKVNFRVMGGLTAGLENCRLSFQYQYGVTNALKNLNDKELENNDFEGNSGTMVFAVVIYF